MKFLDLHKSFEREFLVPCYDIDLIWHTHQVNHFKFFGISEEKIDDFTF